MPLLIQLVRKQTKHLINRYQHLEMQHQNSTASTTEGLILEKSVEHGIIVQDIGFTVLSKNFSFTHRLSGYFLEVLWNQAPETVSN